MVQELSRSKAKRLEALHEEELKKEREKRGDATWNPAIGAGVIPDKIWKKYSPKSKPQTAYNNTPK